MKAGTYSTICHLGANALGIKYSYDITGTVIVAANGAQYTVTLDLTTEDNVRVTGSYSGEISSTR